MLASEIQIQANCIFAGENTITSFGQITALLLSLAPLWSLSVALYRWPRTRRRLERRRRRAALSLSLTHTQTMATDSIIDIIVPNPEFIPNPSSEGRDGKGKGKGGDGATTEHIETVTTALPVGECARPTRALQSAMRGGRARSRSQDPRSPSRTRPTSIVTVADARARARGAHTRAPTGSLLDAVPLPMSTAEEWNELATLVRAAEPGS